MSSSLNVLIVEDEALLALDIQMILEDLGHQVFGEAACLSDLSELTGLDRAPDLAFVDIQLAEGDSGLDACALIRECWKSAVIVFITANPMKIPSDFAGGHAVIAKPFTRNGLISALKYLEEGVTDPPPVSPKPANFEPSPAFSAAMARS